MELVRSRISDQPDVGEFVAQRAVVGEEKYWAQITPLRSTSRIWAPCTSSSSPAGDSLLCPEFPLRLRYGHLLFNSFRIMLKELGVTPTKDPQPEAGSDV